MLDVGVAFSHLDCGLISTSHPNPTLLPDRFFFSFTPIITIRHPARVIPSYLRAFQRLGDDHSHPDFPIIAECFRLERLVFDSFKSFEEARAVKEGRNPSNPIVIDSDKLVRDPRGQMKKLCVLLGIDDTRLRYTWDPPRLEHKCTKLGQAFLDEFSRSTGFFSNPRVKEVNLEDEVESWAKEWDEDTAKILEKKVVAQMEDYEYLLQFSL
ncbi:hypothetical protein L218DRAFT_871189 [Marasmius fiardii PR-910]|nr:hypothetical protein L218DRAFT_871189 [Marasmius fiardii PR-910]